MLTSTKFALALGTALLALATGDAVRAQNGPGPGPNGPGPGCNIIPGAANIGTNVPLSEFPPFDVTETTPSLVGSVQLIRAARIDMERGTITLPLYRSTVQTPDGNFTQWFIVTDSSDEADAASRGLNFAEKLSNTGAAAQSASGPLEAVVTQGGLVDFSPQRQLVPGSAAAPFPPRVASPGSVGDDDYSPVLRIGNIFYNAPVVASGERAGMTLSNGQPNYARVHDQVLAIDPVNRTVTMNLIAGWSFGRPVFYMSTETSDPSAAAIEANTFAPRLVRLELGIDDVPRSAVERIFIAANGQGGGCANPQRQGLTAALEDGFRPNNVFGGIPFLAADYSPIWDANVYQWAPAYVGRGQVGLLNEEFRILALARDGVVTGLNGARLGSTGFAIVCAVAARLN